MIDRSLNYGRHVIRQYLERSLPYRNVLDLGAGKGTDLDSAKQVNPSTILHAVDAHEPNIEFLRSMDIEAHHLDIEKEKLPFNDRSLDIVISNQLLEHTKEIFWILHEVSRVLKVNGKFIVGVPNLASLHNRLLLMIGRQPTPIQLYSAHIRGFTKTGFMDLLNIYNGYNLIDFKGSNFYPFPPLIAKPLADMCPSCAWGIYFLLEKKKEYTKEFLEYPAKKRLETNYYLGQ